MAARLVDQLKTKPYETFFFDCACFSIRVHSLHHIFNDGTVPVLRLRWKVGTLVGNEVRPEGNGAEVSPGIFDLGRNTTMVKSSNPSNHRANATEILLHS